MKQSFSLSSIGLACLMFMPNIFAEVGHPITFKCKKLPCEKKKKSPCGLRTIFIPRSQGSNMARYLAGWKEHLPGCDFRPWGSLSITTEYSRSLDGERMAQYLFGSTQLHFSGSQVEERGCKDLLADYFGLAPDFEGAIAFDPRIDNIIVDLNYYLGLDGWCPGLYIRCNLPIVVSRWDLGIHCHEKNNVEPEDAPFFPECYMAEDATPAAKSIRDALSGNFIFGDMRQPLTFGKFACGREQKSGIAQLDFVVGYNTIADEYSHLGLYLIAIAPTGNTPKSEFVFEPLIGNGRLWELGVGISGHTDVIRGDNHILSFHVNGYLTHQFEKFQVRSFDLIGHGPLSRYMLLKEFDKDDEYNGSLINAIDFTTRSVRVGGSAKIDLAAKMSYYYCGFGIDLGYNVYARSKEQLRLQPDLFPSDFNRLRVGIKGTEGVCYRILNTETGEVEDQEKLNSIQQCATIFSGAAVTNPQPILLQEDEVAITWDSPTEGELKEAFTSDPPIILTTDDLDLLSGAVPHQLTHKFFADVSYATGCCPWEPEFSLGAEVEFDGRERLLSSLNQWGIWFKATVLF